MNIQQSINATFGSVAVLASFNPYLQAQQQRREDLAQERREAEKGERKAQKSEKEFDIVQDELDKTLGRTNLTKGEEASEKELVERQATLAREAYEASPSAERLEAAITSRQVATDWPTAEEVAAESVGNATNQKRDQQAARELTSIIINGGQGFDEWKRKYGGEA